jgi:hypothetical protein
LRINDEPDFDLVKIPTNEPGRHPDLTPPYDEQTSNLTGHAYFAALGQDQRLPDTLRALCASHKLSGNTTLDNAVMEDHALKMRFVASRCHMGSAEFKGQINEMANEAMTDCTDRTAYFIEQMNGLAILDHLTSSGQTDAVTLFNLGVAFCKLDLVRIATSKKLAQVSNQRETLEDALFVEYSLQNVLGLPVKYFNPLYIRSGSLTDRDIEEIKQAVVTKLVQDDGAHVSEFFGNWQPWSNYIENLPSNRQNFEQLHESYYNSLEIILGNDELPEAIKVDKAEGLMLQHRCWKRELISQKSREFLIEQRMDYLIQRGYMPRMFSQGAS